jgi:hypothetical protein
MTWVRNHVLDQIESIALGKTICWRIMADMPEGDEYPDWVIELEDMWGKYQEELAIQEGAEAAKVFMATRSSKKIERPAAPSHHYRAIPNVAREQDAPLQLRL